VSVAATVWWADLDECDPGSFEPLLSADELERAGKLRFARDRSRFIAARGLLRTLLGERLGTEPEGIDFAYGERGKPRLLGETGLRFNLSHSGALLALAVCEGREVGIDIEAIRQDLFAQGIARRYLPLEVAWEIERRSGDERSDQFFRAWVRQEAYAKGHGAGLELIGRSPAADGWSVVDLELVDGYAAALAIGGGVLLDGGQELVAHLTRVGDPRSELDQVVDLVLAGTAEPAG
jgi:4'-phosphopantetheinyl transferase